MNNTKSAAPGQSGIAGQENVCTMASHCSLVIDADLMPGSIENYPHVINAL
jgi:hypothetical protein